MSTGNFDQLWNSATSCVSLSPLELPAGNSVTHLILPAGNYGQLWGSVISTVSRLKYSASRYSSVGGLVGVSEYDTSVSTFNCGASNGLWPHGFAARPHPARTFPRESALFRNPSGAQEGAPEVFRCFQCDQLLAPDSELGAVLRSGSAAVLPCPDCDWLGASRSVQLSCPVHIVLSEVFELPAGNFPAGNSPWT